MWGKNGVLGKLNTGTGGTLVMYSVHIHVGKGLIKGSGEESERILQNDPPIDMKATPHEPITGRSIVLPAHRSP